MRKVIRCWVVMHTVSVRMMEVWHHHSADRQLWWSMRCSNVLLVSGKQRLQHFFIFLQLFTWFVESSGFNFLAFEVDVFWCWSCNKTVCFCWCGTSAQSTPEWRWSCNVPSSPVRRNKFHFLSCDSSFWRSDDGVHSSPSLFYRHCVLWLEGSNTAVTCNNAAVIFVVKLQ